jgi:hypothetical protein
MIKINYHVICKHKINLGKRMRLKVTKVKSVEKIVKIRFEWIILKSLTHTVMIITFFKNACENIKNDSKKNQQEIKDSKNSDLIF